MDIKRNSVGRQIAKQKEFLHSNDADILIAEMLNSEGCKKLIEQCPSYRDRIYTPVVTLLAFINQAMSPDKSCKRAVSQIVAETIAFKEEFISSNTGSFCKARQRLLSSVIEDLVRLLSRENAKKTPETWKFGGRVCKVVDGTMLSMDDSIENRKEYSQHGNQNEGAGYPMMRLVALMSLSDGTIVDFAHAAHKGENTGEHALLRCLHKSIYPGDIILADSYYPSHFCIADLMAIRADVLFRGTPTRKYDFSKGEQLGKHDYIVEWDRPDEKPKWMDKSHISCLSKKNAGKSI